MTVIDIPGPEEALVERAARSMASAGATLTGQERRSLALASREAVDVAATDPSAVEILPLVDVARRIAVAPATIRQDWVRSMEQVGISAPTYVEVLGLVARLQAIDTFSFALGHEVVELPTASDEPPTGRLAPHATMAGGWVPTVGPASPPSALSSVPDEHEAMHDLHAIFYLAVADMADLDADRGLHRTQRELVAARTSLLNECFF